jgi:prepilin-type N-terminal cleavage/methylation domain-containing protein
MDSVKRNSGFTLIELSIVIVIIGLIVAGVVGGQALSRQASLRAITTEVNATKVAINAFKLAYNALPGDMTNATSYWSGTGNGNGNGVITTSSNEDLRAWQHLGLADIIPGSYTGTDSGSHGAIGINMPESKISGVGYYILTQPSGFAIYGQGVGMNGLRFGKMASSGHPRLGFLTPQEAYSIDKKIDDGDASRGTAVTMESDFANNSSTCVSGSYTGAAGSSSYVLSDTTQSCIMEFWLD